MKNGTTTSGGTELPRSFYVAPALLHTGDRMPRVEYHRRYEQYPEDVKFELIDGTVYMASPLGILHAVVDLEVAGLLLLYKSSTPGVEAAHNATVILDE